MTNNRVTGARDYQISHLDQSFANRVILVNRSTFLETLVFGDSPTDKEDVADLGGQSAMEGRDVKGYVEIDDIPLYWFVLLDVVQPDEVQCRVGEFEEVQKRLASEVVFLVDPE
jgi:hypothetical protein